MNIILADDLSGALDTGAAFHKWMPTNVYSQIPEHITQTEGAVVINMNTRHMTGERLANQLTSVILKMSQTKTEFQHIYIKVDSTLRGPVGQTLKLILQILPQYRGILLCTPFPETGRTIVNGRLMVNGQLAECTELSRDPYNPLTSSEVSSILGDVGLPVVRLTLHDVRRAPSLDFGQRAIYVADAVTRKDLEHLSRLIAAYSDILPVGSAGWAQSLAYVWRSLARPNLDLIDKTFSQIVALVGSLHPQSAHQIDYIQDCSRWTVETIVSHRQASMSLPSDRHIALRTPREPIKNINSILNTMATIVTRLLDSDRCIVLVLTGGDTSLFVMKYLNVATLQPIKELSSGVVVSHGIFRGIPLYFITKSGAFGSPSFYEDLEHLLPLATTLQEGC